MLKHIRIPLSIIILLFSVNVVFADVLYESLLLNSSGGVLNGTSWPSLNDGLIIVDDIVVPQEGWQLDTVSNYFSVLGSPEADSAFFVVFSKDLGNVNPMLYATKVPVTIEIEEFTDSQNGQTRTAYRHDASNLNLILSAGEYWIGLSPIADSYAINWMAWGSYTSNGERPLCYDIMQNAYVGLTFWTGPDQMLKIEGSIANSTDEIIQENPFIQLSQNYPNPFNPSTKISFSLQTSSDVELDIYNSKGQRVSTLFNGYLNNGDHSFVWNGVDDNQNKLSSGVYFYRVKTNHQSIMKKMLLMK